MIMSSVSIVLSLVLVAVVKCQDYQPIAAGIAADRCFEPVSTGNCRARFPSFHYNPLTETCDCFIFGGCGANGNKFATLNDCMSTCGVNPQLQTISSTCINMFGTDNPKLTVTPRHISPKPVVFSLETSPPVVITTGHEVIVKATSTAAPVTDAPTSSPSTIAVASTTDATRIAASSNVVPAVGTSSTDTPTTTASSIVAATTGTSIVPPVAASTTTSAPSKPSSTPGPWDHWLNL